MANITIDEHASTVFNDQNECISYLRSLNSIRFEHDVHFEMRNNKLLLISNAKEEIFEYKSKLSLAEVTLDKHTNEFYITKFIQGG